MTSSYLAYGLRLRSDFPIPSLTRTQHFEEVDVAVWFTQESIFADVKDATTDPFFPVSHKDDERELIILDRKLSNFHNRYLLLLSDLNC